ncbi:MAG: hypothetical protein PVG65_00660 [Candidatus Thorarchaeota archaeon]|jgi:hypothetical protein
MTKHKKVYCPECGGEIVMKYRRRSQYFYLNDDGYIERDKNNDLFEDEGIIFICSNDLEHNVNLFENSEDYVAFEFWKTEIEKDVMRTIVSERLI